MQPTVTASTACPALHSRARAAAMAKKERLARTAKAQKSSFSNLQNKIRKKGKNKGMLPSSIKAQQGGKKKRVEKYGFDLTQCQRAQLEKMPVRSASSPASR